MDNEHTILNPRGSQSIASQSPSSMAVENTDDNHTLLNPRALHGIAYQSPSWAPKSKGYSSTAKSSSRRVKYESLGGSAHHTQYLYDTWVADSWVLEIAGLSLALLSMGALIAVLLGYQNKAVPHWRWGITLNSLLSILSQIITLSITSVLGGALSQQKWLWFRNSTRSLKDFGCFDNASKGPWGSLVLLFSKSRIFHFAALGAVLMLFTQTFQPFVQQATCYLPRWEAAQSSNATIPRAIQFDTVDTTNESITRTYVPNPIKAGVYNGLYNSQSSLSDIQPSCVSGKCSWQPHSTLAICAYIADVSLYIQTHTYSSSSNSITTFYTLPSGGLLAKAYQNMSLVATDNAKYISLTFQNNTPAAIFADFYTFLISNKTGNPTLLETSLQLCVQTLNTTVTDGQTETNELFRSTSVIEQGGHKVIVPNDTNNYIMGDYSFNDLSSFLETIFSGAFTVTPDGSITYSSDAIEVLVDALLEEPYDQAAMAIFLNGFATSLTNALRSNLAWATLVSGTLYMPQTYVSVSWPWLTVPILLVLFTSIFLLITIMQNSAGGFGIWRGAGLATLQALGDEAREGMGKGLGMLSALEKSAEEVKVRLKREGGERWVLR